jgi:hypothetical protein
MPRGTTWSLWDIVGAFKLLPLNPELLHLFIYRLKTKESGQGVRHRVLGGSHYQLYSTSDLVPIQDVGTEFIFMYRIFGT